MTLRLAPGVRLGPYEITQSLGAGGMGEVYKARDTRLDRTVAIKVAAAQFTERFEREARAVAALNHPHICQLYDVGPNYLVMEFIEGARLQGPLPLAKTVDYAGQILDALDAAHQRGIVHRDLKPANILVTKQGIKLLDFGLAKVGPSTPGSSVDASGAAAAAGPDANSPLSALPTETSPLTGQGMILGTLQYMSPEQLQGGSVDPRSDLFSFGCVLYEMLSGKRAFDGTSPATVIAAILEREAAPLDVGHPLDRVIKRSLAKDREQRFQTARDLKAALLWALEQSPPVVSSKPTRTWWLAPAGVALVLGAIGGWALSTVGRSTAVESALRFQINPPQGGRFVLGINVGGLALSPDGRTAAYVVTVDGKTGLWVQPLDGAARLVAGTDDAGQPFWSPDGKSIAFFSGTSLRRVDVAGGSPLTIFDGLVAGRGGTWTSDGRILFASAGGAILQVSASGGTPSRLTMPDASRGELTHYRPQMLPGNRFMFAVRSRTPENTGVYAAALDQPTRTVKLLTANTNALYAPGGDGKSYLLWLRGGTLLAQEFDAANLELAGEPRPVADPVGSIANQGLMNVAVSATGLLLYDVANTLRQLAWFDRAGRRLAAVGDPGADFWFRVSPDGRRIVTARDSPDGADLWLLEVERGVSNRLTSSPGVELWPVWSPDGRTVMFSDSSRNLVRHLISGSGTDERLTESPRVQNPLDWSRDGRFVLYYDTAPDTQRNLWVLPMTPDAFVAAKGTSGDAARPRPYLQTRFNEWHGRFSPEAGPRWVAYDSDESGRFEIYLRTFPEPGAAWRISTDGGTHPEWGVGGRELFYLAPDGRLMVVALTLGTDSVEAATPRPLFSLPIVETSSSPYDVAPDGQRFLVPTTPAGAPPLTMIVNWPALLKRDAATR